MSTRARSTGEKGIAILVTAMLLIPLMIFAAFGVDLASWYSRVSYLQKSADAASLAGTVWMPNLGTATSVACASLRENGIAGGPSCGTGPFEVTVERGATATALRVSVTDPRATRYFSQVLGNSNQRLTRSAEAEYNLPIPLGSPLNYFGGDAERTAGDPVTTYSVSWPTDYTTRVPANYGPDGCNIGTSSVQGVGRWTDAGAFTGGHDGADPQCQWTVIGTNSSGTTAVPPPDYFTRAPNNSTCRVRDDGASGGAVLGRWNSGSPPTFQISSGTGTPAMCIWPNRTTNAASIPPHFNTSPPPTNRPCRIGYATSGVGGGRWDASAYQTSTPATIVGENQTTGNRLCLWTTVVTSTTVTPPNPINSGRSPGFWAAVEGPQTRAYQGDAYSTRCYEDASCSSDQNEMYDAASSDRGKWYVIKTPAGLTGSVALNVFDASYVAGALDEGSGDRSLDGGGNFTTNFRVYQQTNALDFSARTAIGSGTANTTDGSCHWSLNQESSFKDAWRNLCNLTVSPNQTYLVNVWTPGTTGAGVNGYALEAVANGSHASIPQPALYAYANMSMQNNNLCEGGGCVPPPATFYLAEVGPQYAGRTLVMELWDSGDVSGSASMFPMMPATTSTNPGNPNLPKPVIPVPNLNCSFTADAEPNDRISGVTGTEYLTNQPSDSATQCGVNTSTGSGARFNGEWLRIRIDIPPGYTCVTGRNPEIQGNSCWWGIRYVFGASANDVTTWQARIEGNPVHLTQ
jgi:hypothetical protein